MRSQLEPLNPIRGGGIGFPEDAADAISRYLRAVAERSPVQSSGEGEVPRKARGSSQHASLWDDRSWGEEVVESMIRSRW